MLLMKRNYYLALLICIFVVFSCKKDKPQPQPQNTTPGLLETYGLGEHLTASNSLIKDYDYYFDQFDGSKYAGINCGPTVTTMAIRWADPSFSKKPVDARNAIPANGGWWFTSDIQNYLDSDNINHSVVSFTTVNANDVIERSINNGDAVIICLDMYYAAYNPIATQHTNKFYQTNGTGWGHFLLIKGYKEVDSKVYYEIYDPYTNHESYADSSPKGKDRYYLSTTITAATNVWWPYAILVAPKGQQVVASTGLQLNSLNNIPVASGR